MNVVVLDSHPPQDSRIWRHLQYMVRNGMNVFRLNFNFYGDRNDTISSLYGEIYKRIDLFDQFNSHSGIIRTLFNAKSLMGKKLTQETEMALRELGLDSSQPTVIHVHDPMILPLAVNLVKSHKERKIVYDRHELYEYSKKHYCINNDTTLETISKDYISGVVVVSDDHIAPTKKRFPGAMVVSVPNYPYKKDYDQKVIENKIYSSCEDTDVFISYIGSLDHNYDRDIDLMLKIGAEAASSGKAKFQIGGRVLDAVLEKQLHDLSEQFGERVSFLGYVPREKSIEVTAKSHIGLYLIKPNTTYWVRCSPNKIFEYLICGVVPVIRADVEYAEDLSKCALLFDRNASQDLVIDEVMKLISDKERLKKMMKSARELSPKFTFDNVADRYIEIYRSIIKK